MEVNGLVYEGDGTALVVRDSQSVRARDVQHITPESRIARGRSISGYSSGPSKICESCGLACHAFTKACGRCGTALPD